MEQIGSEFVFRSGIRLPLKEVGEFPNGSHVRFLSSFGESTKLEILLKSLKGREF
jgi:hypothetical protein